ncbi:multicopper oxidase domain-containing protein [Saccharomonospora sp.]|uniref:multicopper oxidase domain-containing protein n=1 Tax=Saccharomonospora sp. TaxID=33913 RepID=UPI002610F88B|nr:multicopper oxidase domain-containing protein [Saccharomonospora sp.]
MIKKYARTSTFGRQVSRRSMLTGAAAGVAVPIVASTVGGIPALSASPGAGSGRGETRRITMYAEELPDGMVGYGAGPGEATVPGPVLEMWEGETLEIELVNRTDQRLSIHPHGVAYGSDSDGSPLNDSFNEPGECRTYVWHSRTPHQSEDGTWLPGSAGYWHYHDHAMGTPHGTEGLASGLYGALVIRRQGDALPDRQYTIVFNGTTINNRTAPDAPIFEARLGERVEFIAIGHGNNSHTFHLHGHRWADNRTGLLSGPDDPTPVVDNKDLNPGSSFGFQTIAGAGAGPGAWMYHCHMQTHSDDGMTGLFLVLDEDGNLPPRAAEALERYRNHLG